MNPKLLLLPTFSPPLSIAINKMNRYDLMQILDEKNKTNLCLSKRQSTTSALSLALTLSKEQANNNNKINNNSNNIDNSNNIFDLFGGGIVYQQNTSFTSTNKDNNKYEERKFNTNNNDIIEIIDNRNIEDNNNNNNNNNNKHEKRKFNYHYNDDGDDIIEIIDNRLPLESLLANRTTTNNVKSKLLSSLLAPLNEKEKKDMNNEIKKAKKSYNEELKLSLSSFSTISSSSSSIASPITNFPQSKNNREQINNNKQKNNDTSANNNKKNKNKNTANNNNNNNNNDSNSDYDGIQNFCRNASKKSATLEKLVAIVSESKRVSLALLWKGLSSNHASSTVSFCTPKSQCNVWHCKCDKQIRSNIALIPLMGVIFVLPNDNFSYFLQLAYSENGANEEKGFTMPYTFDTTITQRWNTFNTIMNDESIDKIIYNAQLFQFPLVYKGLDISMRTFFDCKIATHLLDPDLSDDNLELDKIFSKYNISVKVNEYDNLGAISSSINYLHGELIALLELEAILRQKLQSFQMINCLKLIEMPLSSLLTKMELLGITMDIEHFEKINSQADKLIKSITTEARALIGQNIATGFNLSSPEQVAQVLYETLQLPTPPPKPKQRHFSTGEEELSLIEHLHPIVPMILNHRTVAKIKSTYIDPYRNFIKGTQTTVHSIFNQTSTRTGRLSSCKPNMQQIPNEISITIENENVSSSSTVSRSDDHLRNLQLQLGLPIDNNNDFKSQAMPVEYKFVLRSVFVARKGSVLISADYSQIEMRVFAAACQDTKLKEVFDNKGDIYTIVASLLFKKNIELITEDERKKAKVICIGQVYGMSPDMAAQKLKISVGEAQKVYDSFFNTFRSVKDWSSQQISRAYNEGYVKTISGRRRYLPDIRSSEFHTRSAACRQAVNTIIQGSAADILKLAMILIDESFKSLLESGYSNDSIPSLLVQVHDELIYEVHIPDIDSMTMPEIMVKCEPYIDIIKNCMEKRVKENWNISVPLIANITCGLNWGEMNEYDK